LADRAILAPGHAAAQVRIKILRGHRPLRATVSAGRIGRT